jgi:hypothetical protein
MEKKEREGERKRRRTNGENDGKVSEHTEGDGADAESTAVSLRDRTVDKGGGEGGTDSGVVLEVGRNVEEGRDAESEEDARERDRALGRAEVEHCDEGGRGGTEGVRTKIEGQKGEKGKEAHCDRENGRQPRRKPSWRRPKRRRRRLDKQGRRGP